MTMQRFDFSGYFGAPSVCGLIQYRKSTFVVVDAPYAEGTSITNAAEIIATDICKKYDVSPDDLLLIEDYPNNKSRYSQVIFDGKEKEAFGRKLLVSQPRWKPLTEEEFNALIESEQ